MARPGEVDTTEFTKMCHELSRLAPQAFEVVVKYEFGKVMERTLALTPAASVAKIRESKLGEKEKYFLMEEGDFKPKRPRKGVRVFAGGRIIYYLRNRYPNALWALILLERKRAYLKYLHARGLAKQSWLAIADKLGIEMRAPSFVRKAIASTGKTYHGNATVRTVRRAGQFGIYFENAQPTVNIPRVGGRRALQRAIDGRVKYFQRNLKNKVFDSVAKIARRYPGVKTNR